MNSLPFKIIKNQIKTPFLFPSSHIPMHCISVIHDLHLGVVVSDLQGESGFLGLGSWLGWVLKHRLFESLKYNTWFVAMANIQIGVDYKINEWDNGQSFKIRWIDFKLVPLDHPYNNTIFVHYAEKPSLAWIYIGFGKPYYATNKDVFNT